MKYKCLVIDDEQPARKLISSYVSKIPELQSMGECKNVMEARSILQKEKIDLLLMDIQMPEISGIEFLRMLKDIPATILITAHPDFAIEGYELDVVDYLLKPVEFGRFYKAVTKAINSIANIENSSQVGEQESALDEMKHIFVKADKEILKINTREILFIESVREYVQIHTRKQKIVTLQSLSKFEEVLPPESFYRVHRSYIVNFEAIDSIMGNSVLIREHTIPISRGQRQQFLDIINKNKLF